MDVSSVRSVQRRQPVDKQGPETSGEDASERHEDSCPAVSLRGDSGAKRSVKNRLIRT